MSVESRKRPAPSPADDAATGGTPLTLSKPQRRSDCVTIDVGGTRFKTTVSTLTASSAYFSAIFSVQWEEEGRDEYFLDRDAQPFGILLSFMRSGQLKLPKDNDELTEAILLEAEYLGIDAATRLVKARAHRNWHGQLRDKRDNAAAAIAFDQEHGGIASALASGVLPWRYFNSCRDQPNVLQLVPAPPGCKVTVKHVKDEEVLTLPVHCLALVENGGLRGGRQSPPKSGAKWIDAVVTHPHVQSQSLASQVFNETDWMKISSGEEMSNAFKLGQTVPATYWKDAVDHSKGSYTCDVHYARTVFDRLGNPRIEAVDLVERDDDDDNDDAILAELKFKSVGNYSNFKCLP